MKTLLYTFLLISFCSIISFGQKKYITKVMMLDKKVVKGVLYHVDEKGIYIIPNNVYRGLKNREDNQQGTLFLDYRLIKKIYLRRKGMVGLGIILGLGTSFLVGKAVSDKQKNSLTGLGMFFVILPIGPVAGGIIGSTSKKFEIGKDSTSVQSLKMNLGKYALYQAKGSIE